VTITASGLYTPAWVKSHTGLIVLNLALETHKAALFASALAVDFDADAGFASAPFTSNQVSGAGYTAGGKVVTGTEWLIGTARILKWISSPIVWNPLTIAAPGVRGVVFYADALATKDAFYLADLGQDFPINGQLTITPPSSGIFFWDTTGT
jgi:hypothetical protein